MKKKLTPLVALCYLDDMAHGRKMSLDPNELKLIIETELRKVENLKKVNSKLNNLIDILIKDNDFLNMMLSMMTKE